MASPWPRMLHNPLRTQDEWPIRPSPTHFPRKLSQDYFLPPPRFWWCTEASSAGPMCGPQSTELQGRTGSFVTGHPTTPITAAQPLLFWSDHFWCVGQDPRESGYSTYIMNCLNISSSLYLYWPDQSLGAAGPSSAGLEEASTTTSTSARRLILATTTWTWWGALSEIQALATPWFLACETPCRGPT